MKYKLVGSFNIALGILLPLFILSMHYFITPQMTEIFDAFEVTPPLMYQNLYILMFIIFVLSLASVTTGIQVFRKNYQKKYFKSAVIALGVLIISSFFIVPVYVLSIVLPMYQMVETF